MYYNFAKKLGKDRPFFGVKLFEPGQETSFPNRPMQEIAAEYVRAIRAAQPHGPYVLVGLCVAGVIAYEAARQLRQAGESVPLLVMADTMRPGYESGLPFAKRVLLFLSDHLHVLQHRIGLIRRGQASIAKVLSFYTFIRSSRILDFIAKLGLIDPSEVGNDDWETWLFLRALDDMQSNFQPSPSTGDVILLKSDEILTNIIEPELGWGTLVKGRIFPYRIPGWHEDIFRDEAGVARIVAVLRPFLEKIDAQRGGLDLRESVRPDDWPRASGNGAPPAAPQAIARALSSTDEAMRSVIAGA